jgi:Fe2+ or Zn2+ uptake regulation protein
MGREHLAGLVAEGQVGVADATEIIDRIAQQGHRLTTPRQTIVALVAPRRDYFSAQEIWDEVQSKHRGIGRATVFRTLDLLVDLGVLNRVHIGDGCHRYTVCETGHHHHLMCVDCGTVTSIEAGPIERQIRRTASDEGFELLTHHLELIGRCSTCRQRATS